MNLLLSHETLTLIIFDWEVYKALWEIKKDRDCKESY